MRKHSYFRERKQLKHMKNIVTISILSLLFLAPSFKAAEEISWVDFNTGYAQAVKKKKLVLVDVYTDWCGWCKVMDRETYTKPEIIGLMKSKFVAVKFNPEKKDITYTYQGKKYNGQELAGVISNYQLTGYPTTIVINPKNNKLHVAGGFMNPVEFKKFLDTILSEK